MEQAPGQGHPEGGSLAPEYRRQAQRLGRFADRLTDDSLRWDNPTMIVTLDAKRRLTVPAALAPAAPGDYFDARFDADEDVIVFRRLAGHEDWLAVLKDCPVSMDDLPPRRRELPRRRKL